MHLINICMIENIQSSLSHVLVNHFILELVFLISQSIRIVNSVKLNL